MTDDFGAFFQHHPGEATIHPPQQFYAGDDWEIAVTCHDADGNPLDLSAANLTWLLNDSENANVLSLTVGDGIALEENVSGDLLAGQCLITVANADTEGLAAGYYFDQLTVEIGGNVMTQFRGRIQVLEKLSEV